MKTAQDFQLPYSIEFRPGITEDYVALMHGRSMIASYSTTHWGNEEKAINAAWISAYGGCNDTDIARIEELMLEYDDYPDIAKLSRIGGTLTVGELKYMLQKCSDDYDSCHR